MNKFKKTIRIIYGLTSLGLSLKDKITLLRLYLHYPLRNRGFYTYSNKVFSAKIKLNNKISQIHLRDNGTDMIIFQAIFIFGEYTPPFPLKKIPTTVYDLGCNIGIFGVWFNSMYPDSFIIGFEPVPENFQIATLNYQNVNGKVICTAIANEKGFSKMLIDKENTGAHRLTKLGTTSESKVAYEIEVETDTLKNLVDRSEITKADFLKIDAEGSELEILQGMEDLINHVEYIVVEPDKNKEAICINYLEKHGFNIIKSKLIWAFK